MGNLRSFESCKLGFKGKCKQFSMRNTMIHSKLTYVGPSYWRRPLAIGFSHLIHRVN